MFVLSCKMFVLSCSPPHASTDLMLLATSPSQISTTPSLNLTRFSRLAEFYPSVK